MQKNKKVQKTQINGCKNITQASVH